MENQKNIFQIPNHKSDEGLFIGVDQEQTPKTFDKEQLDAIYQGLGSVCDTLVSNPEEFNENEATKRLYDIASRIDRERKERITQSEKKAA